MRTYKGTRVLMLIENVSFPHDPRSDARRAPLPPPGTKSVSFAASKHNLLTK